MEQQSPLRNNIFNNILKYKHIYLTILFILVSILIFLPLMFHKNIWYDEAYQLILNRYSLDKIIYFVSQDYSGPIFAIGLKIFTNLFGDSIYVARFLPFLTYCSLFLLAFFPIRRLFSLKVAIYFSLLLILIPISFFTAIEIRTYCFALVFTLGATIYGILTLKENKKIDSVLYVIFSILASYSHNYAILYIFFLTNSLLIYSIKIKKNWKKILFCNLLIFLAFFPWISILLSQANNLEKSFWIKKPNFNTLKYSLAFIFGNYPFVWYLIFILLFFGILLCLQKNKREFKYIIFLLFNFFLPLIFFILWSIYKTPLYYAKYIVPTFAVFLLALAISFKNYSKNILPIFLLIILLLPFSNRYIRELNLTEEKSLNDMISWVESKNSGRKVFYHQDEFSLGVFEYYFEDSKHYLSPDMEIYVTTPEIYGDVKILNNNEKIEDDIDNIIVIYDITVNVEPLIINNFKLEEMKEFNVPYSGNYVICVYKR